MHEEIQCKGYEIYMYHISCIFALVSCSYVLNSAICSDLIVDGSDVDSTNVNGTGTQQEVAPSDRNYKKEINVIRKL